MSHHIIRSRDGKLIGTLSPVEDPSQFEWDAEESIEVFDSQLAFEQRLEDFKPPEKTIPDWGQFQSLMLINGAYFRIVGTNSVTLTLNSALTWMLGEVGQHPERVGDVVNTWNAIAYIAKVTPEEVQSLRKICTACQTPFTIANNGFMVAT